MLSLPCFSEFSWEHTEKHGDMIMWKARNVVYDGS
jgi:hypothetical protein